MMIVAPKRKLHHAVDRNRVRRLTRECYRLRKHTLYQLLEDHHVSIVFSMVYIHNEIMTYEQLGHKMDKLLESLHLAPHSACLPLYTHLFAICTGSHQKTWTFQRWLVGA